MTRDPADDFVHPTVPADWAERHHVLYRLRRPENRQPTVANLANRSHGHHQARIMSAWVSWLIPSGTRWPTWRSR